MFQGLLQDLRQALENAARVHALLPLVQAAQSLQGLKLQLEVTTAEIVKQAPHELLSVEHLQADFGVIAP